MEAACLNRSKSLGLTLIELLLVLTIVGLSAALAIPALRDPAATQLREEADRLAHLLEGARAASRAYDEAMAWRVEPAGFRFIGQAGGPWPTNWLHPHTEATIRSAQDVELGPEPVIAPQAILLRHRQRAELSLWVRTDGVRPFEVVLATPPSRPGAEP
jgi:general secretion pathway protein H